MRFTMLLLGTAAVLATSANATDWSGFSGTLTGGYDYSDVRGTGYDAYNFGGQANYAIPGTKLNVQGLVDYSEVRSQHTPRDTWTSGGALTWRDRNFALGANGDYHAQQVLGTGSNYGTYGVFGEWYAADNLTVRVRGGGISGGYDGFSKDGGYLGAGVNYYILPQLAAKADLSYATLGGLHWTNVEIGPEYMPFAEVPVSLSAAYTYNNTNYYGRRYYSNGLMVRLTWHLGEGNSLVEYDRNGPLDARSVKLPVNALNYDFTAPSH
ncbi:outer membrane beta-barrel protein [Rhizomicrobium electricum]|uniref:Outer membrane protein beta-barrel domain-containing protein n=1 Tax=Rhizomicrobium electricum TaxID=480070 RepID=A0ABN1F7A3_9PROT|nr:outer membrane beta-barrel protein [Rhizomicrobium electricum]NIJ50375.1 hypothetical protein [Rhizomicrobium electricum]